MPYNVIISIAPVAGSSELHIVRMAEVDRLSANAKNIVFAHITKIAKKNVLQVFTNTLDRVFLYS